ncbi:hypothetical protein BD410DRAFT_841371 [Rickenella mellea]|uniref:Uncharacterized protein n=1 Tax=Rickenella mellea TaxID=50990 RepID=A0A4Y7Q044_9AGAM|nr:hypothetical protein BD410DRAFT_841371 [Rickenella mellea]
MSESDANAVLIATEKLTTEVQDIRSDLSESIAGLESTVKDRFDDMEVLWRSEIAKLGQDIKNHVTASEERLKKGIEDKFKSQEWKLPEDDSESPRAGSPWDALPSTSPPKLVPEVEQGNVEYKLKLISPTPERFARLVTQLKWRLLEGGGQALYELGVADSGELIGLEREAMEASLMTLEEMAGEIGASVIVVKEIAVPIPRKMISTQKTNEAFLTETDGEETTTDTDLSTPEPDTDELGMSTLSLSLPVQSTSPSFHMRANPARPTAQSSPALFPLDVDPLGTASNDIPNDGMTLQEPEPAIDLAIASVFKPRPTRRRAPHSHSHGHGHHTGPGAKKRDAIAYANIKTKVAQHTSTKVTVPQAVPITIVPPTPTTTASPLAPKVDGGEHPRRGTRDRRRQEKKLRGHVAGDTVVATKTVSASTTATTTTTAAMVLRFDDDTKQVMTPDVEAVAVISTTTTSLTAKNTRIHPPDSPSTSDSDLDINICSANNTNTPHANTPRLIVEVLVVRKLSVEEAFLDFGGFALEL